MDNNFSNMSFNSVRDISLLTANYLFQTKTAFSEEKLCVGVAGKLEPDFIKSRKSHAQYSCFYDVKLYDQSEEDYILINIPAHLAKQHKLIGGEIINIIGVAKLYEATKNIFKLQFDVKEISRLNVLPDLATDETNNSNRLNFLAELKSINSLRKPFPIKHNLNIALLHPISDTTVGDFKLKLPEQGVFIREYPTNIANKNLILETFQKIKSDSKANKYPYEILAIIRGGGDGFEVFDDLDVCKEFAMLDFHKIVGLGHENNKSLIEFVADHSEATPSYLCTYIHNQVKATEKTTPKKETTNKLNSNLELINDNICDLYSFVDRKIESSNNKLLASFENKSKFVIISLVIIILVTITILTKH